MSVCLYVRYIFLRPCADSLPVRRAISPPTAAGDPAPGATPATRAHRPAVTAACRRPDAAYVL